MKVEIPLDLAGAKTYIAALATLAGSVLGFFGYVNPDLAWLIGFGGVALTMVFLRMGVKKAETGETDIQGMMNDIMQVLAEMKEMKEDAGK